MTALKQILRRAGTGASDPSSTPAMDIASGLEPGDIALITRVRPFTLTSNERIMATVDAVDYIVRRRIEGAFAECGVWRGGSVLAMIVRLQHHGIADRDIYLYDTFEGMTKPSECDTSRFDEPATETWKRAATDGTQPWATFFGASVFSFEEVRELLLGTGYPSDRIHFIVGRVEDTLPSRAPERLALLRLDTDWYETTKHELVSLYPRLSTGGVLLVDDYGHWDGARRAVDEFFSSVEQPVLLHRTDYSGRAAIKV